VRFEAFVKNGSYFSPKLNTYEKSKVFFTAIRFVKVQEVI